MQRRDSVRQLHEHQYQRVHAPDIQCFQHPGGAGVGSSKFMLRFYYKGTGVTTNVDADYARSADSSASPNSANGRPMDGDGDADDNINNGYYTTEDINWSW